jgi:hypothetical protein
MGKPITLQHGKRYLLARCPKCNEVVDAIPDPGPQRSREAEASWVISCTECGTGSLDLNKIEAETWIVPDHTPLTRR